MSLTVLFFLIVGTGLLFWAYRENTKKTDTDPSVAPIKNETDSLTPEQVEAELEDTRHLLIDSPNPWLGTVVIEVPVEKVTADVQKTGEAEVTEPEVVVPVQLKERKPRIQAKPKSTKKTPAKKTTAKKQPSKKKTKK